MPSDLSFELDPDALARLRRAAEAAVTAGALVVEGQVKQLTPVVSGGLRDSITHESAVTSEGAVAEVGSALTYAPYVEYGTGDFATNGAGRKGGWVYTAADGKMYFTRGNKPVRMFQSGFKRAEHSAVAAMGDTFARVMQS